MKNKFCDLTEKQISALKVPVDMQGLLFSPFQHNERNGYVWVPTEVFKEFTDVVTEHAQALSSKTSGFVVMEIFHDGGPDPFVCSAQGNICLEQLAAAQKDFRENLPDELERGEGIYTFSFYYDKGQYDDMGRCEIEPGWGFDFVSHAPFEAEEVTQ